jgi:hypothetical protein
MVGHFGDLAGAMEQLITHVKENPVSKTSVWVLLLLTRYSSTLHFLLLLQKLAAAASEIDSKRESS